MTQAPSAPTTATTQVYRVWIKTTPERIWAAITDPEWNARYGYAAPGFYEAVLFERNARWLPLIEPQLREGDLFIAVGAAHLFGERGILAELQRRGYTVKRIGG